MTAGDSRFDPPRVIRPDSCPSTNTELSRLAAEDPSLPHGTLLVTGRQSAGRGQRGNSWEADPGLNLTLSLLLRPRGLAASRQFVLSRAVSLAVARTVASLLPAGRASEVSVKWPNDVYVGDRKIAGILIELALCGASVTHAVAGIGLNVNQTVFRGGAPNPVSLTMLTGRTYCLDEMMRDLCRLVLALTDMATLPGGAATLHDAYMRVLWRREGEHTWRRRDTGALMRASVHGIEPDGHLLLRDSAGRIHRFAFKEVAPLLGDTALPN